MTHSVRLATRDAHLARLDEDGSAGSLQPAIRLTSPIEARLPRMRERSPQLTSRFHPPPDAQQALRILTPFGRKSHCKQRVQVRRSLSFELGFQEVEDLNPQSIHLQTVAGLRVFSEAICNERRRCIDYGTQQREQCAEIGVVCTVDVKGFIADAKRTSLGTQR